MIPGRKPLAAVVAAICGRRYASSSLPLRREGLYLGVTIRELPVATWILADNPETRGNLGLDYSRVDPRDLRVFQGG